MNPTEPFTMQEEEKCVLSYSQINGNDFLLQRKNGTTVDVTWKMVSDLVVQRSLEREHFWCVVGRNAHDSIV